MKKMIMVIGAAVCGMSVAAEITPLDRKTCTAEEAWAIANAALSCTNLQEAVQVCRAGNLWTIAYRNDLTEERNKIDSALAEKGIPGVLWGNVFWPKTSALRWEILGLSTNVPHCVEVCRKYNVSYSPWDMGTSSASLPELVGILDDFLHSLQVKNHAGYASSIDTYTSIRKAIQRRGEKVIKKWLRRQGKSFVTKDGVNPCAVYMERLTAALNAPRFAGLNDWLEEMGISERIDLSLFPSEAEVLTLRERILDADEELTEYKKTLLHLCLGVDSYNAFVKEYNGDK